MGLAVAAHNLTGNKAVVILLNRFGHTLSYGKVLSFEKDLMKKYEEDKKNGIILPSPIQPGTHVSFVSVNNDLCEEMLSGAGTTHVTNGIITQREVRITLLHTLINTR